MESSNKPSKILSAKLQPLLCTPEADAPGLRKAEWETWTSILLGRNGIPWLTRVVSEVANVRFRKDPGCGDVMPRMSRVQ